MEAPFSGCFFYAQNEKMKPKIEFCKILLIGDYIILVGLLIAFVIVAVSGTDVYNFAIIISAWIAQIGISSGFYYWKAKAENIVKLPIYMLNDMPEEMKDRIDPNQIVASTLSLGIH